MTEKNKDKFVKFEPEHPRSIEDIDEESFLIIPVVVHVIYLDSAENISDEQIKSQIKVLNEDFGHYGNHNIDLRGVDTRIKFCLAKKDENGAPTTGIVRIKSVATDLTMNNEMLTKNLSLWDPDRYLNIWVVRSIDGSALFQGYSYLPSESGGPNFAGDGLVITSKYFGLKANSNPKYNLGRVTTHEVGHYFDLLHIWGGDGDNEGDCDDDDGIDDTPVCDGEWYSYIPSCPNPLQCNNRRMVENFMDYSDEPCMKLFTYGQGYHMKYAIERYRNRLASISNVADCGCEDLYWGFKDYYDSIDNRTTEKATLTFFPVPTYSGSTLKILVESKDTGDLLIDLYDVTYYLGGQRHVMSKEFKNVSRGILQIDVDSLKPGGYVIRAHYLSKIYIRKIWVHGVYYR